LVLLSATVTARPLNSRGIVCDRQFRGWRARAGPGPGPLVACWAHTAAYGSRRAGAGSRPAAPSP